MKYDAFLLKHTHVVQYNPNCPKPFMVRIVGYRKAVIDHLEAMASEDAIGYGMTICQASRAAQRAYQSQKKAHEA